MIHTNHIIQRGLPHIFDGKASDSEEILEWILELNGLWLQSSEGSVMDDEMSEEVLDDKDPHYHLVRKQEGEADQTFMVDKAPSVPFVNLPVTRRRETFPLR